MLTRISNRGKYRFRFAVISYRFENRIDPNHKKTFSVTRPSKIIFFLVGIVVLVLVTAQMFIALVKYEVFW
jgi:hypothetical protein